MKISAAAGHCLLRSESNGGSHYYQHGISIDVTLHLCHNVTLLKFEHQRLLESEEKLSTYDERLKQEREKMTTEERFTKRETEIARLICTGLTNKAIGERCLFPNEP